MNKSNLNPRDRKRLARFRRELKEMDDLAYKHDMDESFAEAGEKLNSRYVNATNEIKRLSK